MSLVKLGLCGSCRYIRKKPFSQEAWNRTLLLYKGMGILSVGAASAAQKRQGGDGVCCAAEAAPTLMAFFEQRCRR